MISLTSTVLKELRQRARLTQAELAERLGMDQSHVSRLERGKREANLGLLVTWAEACGYRFTVVGPEHDEVLRQATSLGADDLGLLLDLLVRLPHLGEDQRKTLRILIDGWKVQPSSEQSGS